MIVAAIVVTSLVIIPSSFQKAEAILGADVWKTPKRAPIATSGGNNVYITWWSNKTGNDEVMFKASVDDGKTWSNKMNLSNTPKSDSQDAQIAAQWERNQTSNEPVMRISNDNGKTFGEKIMLQPSNELLLIILS